MALYHEDIVDIDLENGTLHRSFLNHSIGSGDDMANRFGVRAFRNGQPEDIGGSCFGLFIRADGATVTISNGAVSGNEAYITLPEACYAVEGQFALAIKCEGGSVTGTMRIVDGVVSRTSTDSAVDPGTVIPSVSSLIAAIDEAVESIPLDYSDMDNVVKYINSKYFFANDPAWELGTASSTDGSLQESTNNIRTQKIVCEAGTKITAESGYLVMVFKYNAVTGAYIGTMDTWASTYTTDARYSVIMLAKYSDSRTISAAADVSSHVAVRWHNMARLDNILTPDKFAGSDTEKIQAALDELATSGGTILLTREYTLTGNVRNTLDTNSNIAITLIGIGKGAKISCGSYSFTGSQPGRTGGLWFDNVVFTGSGTAFDCSALIRMHFTNCYFSGFTNVFYAGNERHSSKYFQSLYIDMCIFRGITGAVFFNAYNAVFDVHVTNSTVEASKDFFKSTGHDYIAFLSVCGNCIEGLTGAVFIASANQAIDQCAFNGNHFEQNAKYFDLTSMLFPANMSICDNFIGENQNKPFVDLPAYVTTSNGHLTVERNTLADKTGSCHVFGLPNGAASGNYKGIVHRDNRFNNLTAGNANNMVLPLLPTEQLTFSGTDFENFVSNALAYLAVAQNQLCETYSIMWQSNGYYTFVVNQFESGKASAFIFNINKACVAQYTTAATNIREITLT